MKKFVFIIFCLISSLFFSCTKQEADLFMPKSSALCGFYCVMQEANNQYSSWNFNESDYQEIVISNSSSSENNIVINCEDFSYLVNFENTKFAQKSVEVLTIQDGYIQGKEDYKVDFLNGEVFTDKVIKAYKNQKFTTDSIYFEIIEGENHFYYHGFRKTGF